jgi:YfiH family protein
MFPTKNPKQDCLALSLLDRPDFFHFFGMKGLSEETAKGLHAGKGSSRVFQVHGDEIITVTDRETQTKPLHGDSIMTDRAGMLLTIFTADCLPVIMIDPNRRAVAIVHAGWRGSLLKITAKTILAMTKTYGSNPNDLLVGLGHHIGPCCFEVGREVWEPIEKEAEYREVVTHKAGDSGWVDLSRMNSIQLMAAGVLHEHIATLNDCTACDPARFHSYRRDHVRGQNMVSGVLIHDEQ